MSVKKTISNNGLAIISDKIDSFETVSIGIFVNVGSINESEKLCGISHFVEHMAFKGTEKRTAFEISEAIESVGGYMNAYTGKEITAYYIKVLKNDLPLAADVLTDIVKNSTFNPVEFEKERGVIIQEIKQMNDIPDDTAFELFQSQCFEGEELGRPILGTIDSINALKPTDLCNYLNDNYRASKMTIAASGNVFHKELVDLLEQFTQDMPDFKQDPPNIQIYKGGFSHKYKDLEQMHIVIGFEGVNHTSLDRFDQMVFSSIMGGGMSSRLFQEIREKRGLAYSVFSFSSSYKDTGTFGIYSGSEENNALEIVKVIKDELMKIKDTIQEEEIEKAKTQLEASYLMGLESSSTRMERIASQYLLHGKIFTASEIKNFIRSVNINSVKKIIDKILSSYPTIAIVGSSKNVEEIFKVFK